MKDKYDVTVIIPVYNIEKYLARSIDSIINQTYDFNKIEIILINDASKDNSAEICQKYADKYSNIIFHNSKENHGVSYSRNYGIKHANGKYIMLLDGDDTVSNVTVENLVNFFDKHYDEVDLVTYPMEHIYETGKKEISKKYSLYDNGDGVYDLNKYHYLDQSTINVIFKKEGQILYDETMFLGEDTKFNTMTLMQKEKIGFVKDAMYYYYRREESASRQTINPYYSFDRSITYYEMMLKEFTKKGKLHPYVQGLILINICYKLKNDVLFPYHLKDKEYENAYNRLINVIKSIDVETIVNYKDVDAFRKFYLYQLQNKKGRVEFQGDKYQIIIDDIVAYENKYTIIMFNMLKIKNNQLEMMATIKSPLHLYYEPNIYISYVNDKGVEVEEKLNIFSSNFSYNYTTLKYNDFYAFKYTLDLKKAKEFKFYTLIEGHKIYGRYEFEKFSPIQPKVKRYNFVKDNKKIIYKPHDEKFIVTQNTILKQIKKIIKENLYYCKRNPTVTFYRLFGHTKKEIWIYQDRGDIHDNGYTQYIHDLNKKDGIKRYYIGNKNNDNIKNFVKFNSFKHKRLYLKASKLITSFSDFQEYCPYSRNFAYYTDLVNYDLIYLQHGILHATLISMYSKEYTEIAKIVVSSHFEYENLQNKYHYDKKDLIACGMPRMNSKEKRNINSKKIVFAPSWRSYLIGKYIKGTRKDTPDVFLKSNYYIKINNFLNSQELSKLLDENDMTLEFKLHPIFKGYKELFKFSNDRISISFDEIDPKEYAIFITDFSSFQFDFAKLEIPIIYFLPDEEEFKAGLHSYRELDLKYEDAFGNLCLDDKHLLKELEKVIKNKCLPDKKYLERMNNFFITSEDPCEEIYKAISQK